MSSVIDFLEKMGSEAQWRHASQEELEVALVETDISTPERSAILANDIAQLQVLLHTETPFTIMIPPDEEEGEEDEEEEGDEKSGLRGSSSAAVPLRA
jgi:hypothetical protein